MGSGRWRRGCEAGLAAQFLVPRITADAQQVSAHRSGKHQRAAGGLFVEQHQGIPEHILRRATLATDVAAHGRKILPIEPREHPSTVSQQCVAQAIGGEGSRAG